MAYVPARVERLDDRVARHKAEKAKVKAQGFAASAEDGELKDAPAENGEANLSVSKNTIDDEKG